MEDRPENHLQVTDASSLKIVIIIIVQKQCTYSTVIITIAVSFITK